MSTEAKRIIVIVIALIAALAIYLAIREAGQNSLGGDQIDCSHGVCSDGSTY